MSGKASVIFRRDEKDVLRRLFTKSRARGPVVRGNLLDELCCDVGIPIAEIIADLERVSTSAARGAYKKRSSPKFNSAATFLALKADPTDRASLLASYSAIAKLGAVLKELSSVYDQIDAESRQIIETYCDVLTRGRATRVPEFVAQFPLADFEMLIAPLPRRRGAPRRTETIEIAVAVGRILLQAGITLAQSRQGAYSRALEIVLDSASIRRPADLFDLIQWASVKAEYERFTELRWGNSPAAVQ